LAGVAAIVIALASLLKALFEAGNLRGQPVGMTLMEGFFELFETLLSFLSNTLSYVRMGAFAVAHGALSMVIFILARMVDPSEGVGYWIVVTLGNLFIVGFEGMIVSIQTLRLEYYEFFSKFFAAGGVRFQPLTLVNAEEPST
jgi:V/A-type H+-transporting ATPase subunit I